MLRAGIDNLPVTGSDRFSGTRESMTMKRIGISQSGSPPINEPHAKVRLVHGPTAMPYKKTLPKPRLACRSAWRMSMLGSPLKHSS
jgi:hypothetical protein